MGMLIGFFLLIYILVAIGVYKLTKRFSSNKWVHRAVLAIIFLIPTYDIIITNTLGAYYCLTTPSTYINKKVEYPLSIYWEDNVYPGFSEEDRKLMIVNYLDGKHLKTMALNGDDGKVYVYTRDVPKEKYEQYLEERKETKVYAEKLDKENRVLLEQISDLVAKENILTLTQENYKLLSKDEQSKLLSLDAVWLKQEDRDKIGWNTWQKYIINTSEIRKLRNEVEILESKRPLEAAKIYEKYFGSFAIECMENEKVYAKDELYGYFR